MIGSKGTRKRVRYQFFNFFWGVGPNFILPTSYLGGGVSGKPTFADMGEGGVKKWGKSDDVLNGWPHTKYSREYLIIIEY